LNWIEKMKKAPQGGRMGRMMSGNPDTKLDQAGLDKKYPADAKQVVRNRLKDFLDISATVDFDAEVSNGRFTNPEYQAKNGYWKMCYRAGKEVVQAAREEAR